MLTIEEIKSFMKQNNITYQQLSDKSGIPLNTLKNIFRLKTRNPRIDTMQAIERALGIDAPAPTDAPITDEQRELVALLQQMTEDEILELSNYVDFIISKRK